MSTSVSIIHIIERGPKEITVKAAADALLYAGRYHLLNFTTDYPSMLHPQEQELMLEKLMERARDMNLVDEARRDLKNYP